jgi:hypothetical protein
MSGAEKKENKKHNRGGLSKFIAQQKSKVQREAKDNSNLVVNVNVPQGGCSYVASDQIIGTDGLSSDRP